MRRPLRRRARYANESDESDESDDESDDDGSDDTDKPRRRFCGCSPRTCFAIFMVIVALTVWRWATPRLPLPRLPPHTPHPPSNTAPHR